MKTDIPVFDLIDQCEFKVDNPFDLPSRLFPSLSTDFETEMFKSWLGLVFSGESLVSVFYNTIANKVLEDRYDGHYSHLDQETVDQLVTDLRSVAEDEERHRDIFIGIVNKLDVDIAGCNPDVQDPSKKEFQDLVNSSVKSFVMGKPVDDPTLLDQLTAILTMESYALATVVMFYRQTTDDKKRQILKSFVQDEARHIQFFHNFLRKANIPDTHKQSAQSRILDIIVANSRFELIPVIEQNSLNDETLKNAYDLDFHTNFSKIYQKNCWQFFNIVYPEYSQSSFDNRTINYKIADIDLNGRI